MCHLKIRWTCLPLLRGCSGQRIMISIKCWSGRIPWQFPPGECRTISYCICSSVCGKSIRLPLPLSHCDHKVAISEFVKCSTEINVFYPWNIPLVYQTCHSHKKSLLWCNLFLTSQRWFLVITMHFSKCMQTLDKRRLLSKPNTAYIIYSGVFRITPLDISVILLSLPS